MLSGIVDFDVGAGNTETHSVEWTDIEIIQRDGALCCGTKKCNRNGKVRIRPFSQSTWNRVDLCAWIKSRAARILAICSSEE